MVSFKELDMQDAVWEMTTRWNACIIGLADKRCRRLKRCLRARLIIRYFTLPVVCHRYVESDLISKCYPTLTCILHIYSRTFIYKECEKNHKATAISLTVSFSDSELAIRSYELFLRQLRMTSAQVRRSIGATRMDMAIINDKHRVGRLFPAPGPCLRHRASRLRQMKVRADSEPI